MDPRLYKATIEGNVGSFTALIQEDALILDRITNTTPYLETPLHMAILLNHDQLAIEILTRKPEFATHLDSTRSTPLHLASAKGNVGLVKALLTVNPDMCYACDRDGRNPVHVAAMRGRIEVLKEILAAKPDAALAVVNGGAAGESNILHLCVEYRQLEALKTVIENVEIGEMINGRDRNGNTVLHLAVADQQVQTTDYLLSIPSIQINTPNLNGITSMDILIQRRSDINKDIHLQQSLIHAGANETKSPRFAHDLNIQNPDSSTNPRKNPRITPLKDDWLDKKRSALMVVASLIATMAFQVGVAPPGNLWAHHGTVDDSPPGGGISFSRLMYNHLTRGARFYISNTISFIASLSIILLLMSGLPFKNKFFMWFLTVVIWIAITASAVTYTIAVILATPAPYGNSILGVIGMTMFIWICLMALLLIGHTLRLSVRTVKLFVKIIKLLTSALNMMRRSTSNTTRV